MVLWLSRGGFRGLPTLLANLRVVAYCLKYAWLALLRSNVRGFVSEGIVRQLSLPRREAPALVSGPQRLYRVGLRLRVCQTGLERGPPNCDQFARNAMGSTCRRRTWHNRPSWRERRHRQ